MLLVREVGLVEPRGRGEVGDVVGELLPDLLVFGFGYHGGEAEFEIEIDGGESGGGGAEDGAGVVE